MSAKHGEVLARLIEANSTAVVSVLRGESGSALDALTAARMLEKLVGDVLQALAIDAREAGSTWQQIANVMQTTRQAAFQRFGRIGTKEEQMGLTNDQAEANAKEILTDYLAKAWAAVRKGFDDRMLAGLSEKMLADTTSSIDSQVGELLNTGAASTKAAGEHVVVDIPLEFERGPLKFRVSFDVDGKVSGLFLLNPEVA